MPRLIQALPKLRTHKATGRAMVTLDGQDIYLGPAGSLIARTQHDRLGSDWLPNGRVLPNATQVRTVSEVIARFWEHAQKHYRRPNGTHTSEPDNYRQALGPLRALYGEIDAEQFGPLFLRAVRQEMIRRNWARTNINKQIVRIRSVFKWAASQELVSHSIYDALRTLAGLSAGRSEAKETEPVRPVDEAEVEAILPLLSRQLQTVVRLQLLTAEKFEASKYQANSNAVLGEE